MPTKTEVITFRTGPKMKQAGELLAAEREMTLGELARHALGDYLLRHADEIETAEPTRTGVEHGEVDGSVAAR